VPLGNRARLAIAAVAAALLLMAPGPASAANTFVDDDALDNTGDCLTPATACKTISGVTGGVAKAGAGDTVWVDGGVYTENVLLNSGKSLREADFNSADMDAEALIDGGPAAAINIAASAAGTVQGLTLRGSTFGVTAQETATLAGNVFDSHEDGSSGVLVTGDDVIIAGNQLTDDTVAGEERTGIWVASGAEDATITGNSFSNLSTGVLVDTLGGEADVIGNEFTGTHQASSFGVAISIIAGEATLVANHIHSPLSGINIGVVAASPDSAAMRRNRILGHSTGVFADDEAPLTMSSDVLKDNTLDGLQAADFGANGGGDVTATNLTFAGNATDITLFDTMLTLGSSIVEDPIAANGTAACLIDFSRGPSPVMGGNGCADFDTDAPPGFLPDGYHLSPFSPLADLGDPAGPVPPDDLDIDAQPLAADSNCDGIARRNIGADEFQRACSGTGAPADAPAATTPQSTPRKKKCKRKKKGAAAAKKCKRKKK
jgi:nitrous oxidase accessory protein NosD